MRRFHIIDFHQVVTKLYMMTAVGQETSHHRHHHVVEATASYWCGLSNWRLNWTENETMKESALSSKKLNGAVT